MIQQAKNLMESGHLQLPRDAGLRCVGEGGAAQVPSSARSGVLQVSR